MTLQTAKFTIDAIGRIPNGNPRGDDISLVDYAMLVVQGIDPQPEAVYPIITGTYTIPPAAYTRLLAKSYDGFPDSRVGGDIRWVVFAYVCETWQLDNLQVDRMTYEIIDA